MKLFSKFFLAAFIILGFNSGIFAQPDAPKNLTATQLTWDGYVYVQLNWQGTPGVHMNHTFYNVYRKEGAVSDSDSFKKIYDRVPMESWADKFVRKGHTYTYFVTAQNKDGVSTSSDTVEISLDTAITKAVVTGTLTNEKDNSAVVKGTLSFIPVVGWGMTTVKTDSLGNYKARLFPGKYILFARAYGFYPEYYDNVKYIFNATKLDFQSGDSVGISIALNPEIIPVKHMLSGTVQDSLGNPLNAVVHVYSLKFNTRSHLCYETRTDSVGAYSIPVLEGDTVVVYARSFDKDYYPEFYNDKATFLDADRIPVDGDINNIDFVLQHKMVYNNGITGLVKNSNDQVVRSIIIAFRKGAFRDEHHKKYSTVTDSSGSYTFEHMYPGKYILFAVPQDGYKPTFFTYSGDQTYKWREADSVMVDTSGIVSGIDFTLQAFQDSGAAVVHGKVKDNSGNDIDGAIVFAMDSNQQVYAYGVTDAKGNYTISGLVPGTYNITTDKFEYSGSSTNTVNLDYTQNYSASASFTLTPESVTAVNDKPEVIQNYNLAQNYPNPFNPTTTIAFQIPSNSRVVLKIYNILGKEVATLVDGMKEAGKYNVTFNGSNLASGVYFYQLNAGNFVSTKKLILMK